MFSRVDVKRSLEQEIEKDPSFKAYVEEIDEKYELIKSLVQIRKNLKITQDDIAVKTGMTRQMVSKIENLNSSPTLDTFLKYISALGVKIDLKPKKGS